MWKSGTVCHEFSLGVFFRGQTLGPNLSFIKPGEDHESVGNSLISFYFQSTGKS